MQKCKNIRVFNINETITIRSHVLMDGFVEDYMNGEERNNNNAPPSLNPIDEIMQNNDFGAMFDDVDANSSGESSSDDGAGHGSDGVNDIGVDGGGDGCIGGSDSGHGSGGGYDNSEDDELDEDANDYLTQWLHNTKEEILVGSAKGFANFFAAAAPILTTSGATPSQSTRRCGTIMPPSHFSPPRLLPFRSAAAPPPLSGRRRVAWP
jgi:hypothetical protein